MTIRACSLSALIIATVCTLHSGPLASPAVAQSSSADNGPQGSTSPGGAPLQPQVLPLAPPFVLSPADEGNLNQLLGDWEKASNGIKTFKCTFMRLEYDPAINGGDPNQPSTRSEGEIKYAAPDQGMFKVEKVTNYVIDPKTGKIVEQKAEPTEWWTCNGKSMFEVTVRNNQTLVVETPLPPEMRGQAITDGPLPFVFGAQAKVLKSRYFMRIITPEANAKNEVWLEAFPKQQKDAANFSQVTLILKKPDLQPSAIQIFNPGANAQNNSRTVIMLKDPSINGTLDALQNFFNNFSQPNPLGAKHVMNQNLMQPPAAAKLPDAKGADTSQASRATPAAK
jgi:TIGR03009 family protein